MIDVDQVALEAARQLTADKDVQGRAVMQCAIAAAIRNAQIGRHQAAAFGQPSPAGQGDARSLAEHITDYLCENEYDIGGRSGLLACVVRAIKNYLREGFEAWARANGHTLTRAADGEYCFISVRDLWNAWQSDALAASQPVRIYGCCAQLEGELHTAECPNIRHLVAARQLVGHVPSNPLLAVARRNIRQFLAKASFASSADRFAAGHCMDVLEAAIDAPPAQAVAPEDPWRGLYNPNLMPTLDGVNLYHVAHPDLPSWPKDEDEERGIGPLITAQGFAVEVVFGEYPEDEGEEVDYCAWLASWAPNPPAGDAWRLVCIQDTEDGPAAFFVRPLALIGGGKAVQS